MRKISKRFPRKAGNVFLVELRSELYALGVLHDGGCTTFSKTFYDDSEADIDLNSFQDKLFTVSVQATFFAKSNIYAAGKLPSEELNTIPLSRNVIRLKSRPFDPANPFGHNGPFPWQGGDLVEVKNSLTPETSSNGLLLKPNLSCLSDQDLIEATEVSSLYVNYELKERLVACYLSGKNVDAFKARAFDDCPQLTNEHVLNTHWYNPKRMPLLGLVLNEAQNTWEPSSLPQSQ